MSFDPPKVNNEATVGNFPDRPRVAIIASFAFSLSNFRMPLIQEMANRGYDVFALAPDFSDRERTAMIAAGATPVDFALSRAGMNMIKDAADTVKLTFLLRRMRIDVVLNSFVKPAIFGTLAAKAAGVRRRAALIAGLGYAFTPDTQKPSWRKRLLSILVARLFKLSLRFADVVFFQNEDDRTLFTSRRLASPEKCVLLNGTGVDLQRFAVVPPHLTPVTFLLMARLLREKGVYEYVEAARRLRRGFPSARFLLLGTQDANPGSIDAETVAGWVNEGVVEWPGHVDDVIPWIARTSVYVLPSWREGAPRSTQEALALGRPIVTTDAPGCRDTVVEGVNGFKVPVQDVDALTEAMKRFLVEPALIASMGRASRALAEERYDIHSINSQILDAIGLPPLIHSDRNRT